MSMKYNFPDHTKGDTFKGQTFGYERNGAPIDLTGATINLMLKKTKTGPSAFTFSTGNNITITDAVNGRWSLDSTVIDIEAGTYYYDVELTENNGNVSTYLSGKWVILQDVTF